MGRRPALFMVPLGRGLWAALRVGAPFRFGVPVKQIVVITCQAWQPRGVDRKDNTMATLWYYGRDGQRLGPVSSTQLKDLADRGNLAPTDLV